jgi:hypothetical protein
LGLHNLLCRGIRWLLLGNSGHHKQHASRQ